MASLRDTFKSIEEWTRRALGPPKEAPKEEAFWTDEMRAFLYAKTWVPCVSTHHKAAWFDIYRNEFHVRFLDDAIVTVENFTTANALYYFRAASKGVAYWDLVRVRGKGGAKLTKKPFRYGM